MTNGAAVSRAKWDAVMKAVLELLERDSIMRFWYTDAHQKCRHIPLGDIDTLLREVARDYGYEIIQFEISPYSSCAIVLTFLIAHAPDYPALVCSAAADFELIRASRSSLLEGVQTLFALAMNTANFDAWTRAGMPMTKLDHHMYYFAEPIRATQVSSILIALRDSAPIAAQADRSWDGLAKEMRARNIEVYACNIAPAEFGTDLYAIRAISESMIDPFVGTLSDHPLLGSTSKLHVYHPFP